MTSANTLCRPFAYLRALALVVSAAACSPEVPAAPSYAKDVQPIFIAHCVRCHDEMFRTDPMSKTVLPLPMLCHLNRFEATGDCSGAAGAVCSYGAQFCAGIMINTRITAPVNALPRMPPAPADPLNDWEKDVLTRWGTNPLP